MFPSDGCNFKCSSVSRGHELNKSGMSLNPIWVCDRSRWTSFAIEEIKGSRGTPNGQMYLTAKVLCGGRREVISTCFPIWTLYGRMWRESTSILRTEYSGRRRRDGETCGALGARAPVLLLSNVFFHLSFHFSLLLLPCLVLWELRSD